MATTFDISNAIDAAASDNFAPTIWETEIVAAYKSALVMANLVKKMKHNGKPGQQINVQRPDRNTAASKSENNFVTLQTHTDTQVNILLDNHWEYSVLIEDFAALQSISSLRSIYTEDAGYALAKKVDDVLHAELATAGGGTQYSDAVIGSDGSTNFVQTTSGNGAALTDAGIRRVLQTFNDNDVPMQDRYLVIPPVAANTLLGLSRFTEQAFVGDGNAIKTGKLGNIYGVDVYVSSNCASVDSSDCTTYRACAMFQKNAICYVEQQAIRVQADYMLQALGTLLVADVIFGADLLRGDTSGRTGEGVKAIIVPS